MKMENWFGATPEQKREIERVSRSRIRADYIYEGIEDDDILSAEFLDPDPSETAEDRTLPPPRQPKRLPPLLWQEGSLRS
jgi:hypothetical protein